MGDTEEASVNGEAGSGMCIARKSGDWGSFARWEDGRSAKNSPNPLVARLRGVGVDQLLRAACSGGSLLHSMAASSSAPGEKFCRPRERLEERREEGEEDLTEGDVEPLLFSTEVMICNAPDVGRLFLPLVPSSFTGELGGRESLLLNL